MKPYILSPSLILAAIMALTAAASKPAFADSRPYAQNYENDKKRENDRKDDDKKREDDKRKHDEKKKHDDKKRDEDKKKHDYEKKREEKKYEDRLILCFETMVGVQGPFTGDKYPIRGINGGGLPWVIKKGEGWLRADGKLVIKVRGLVLDPKDPAVKASGRAGINPVDHFQAIVSCLTIGYDGYPEIHNFETGLFKADVYGNSEIQDWVDLPYPCIAPIVFVTSPTGSWFAATGY